MEPMGNVDDVNKQQPQKTAITLFGIPIIQTKCQKDAFFYGISGGILCGLVAFLFTSHPNKSTRIAVYCYGAITFCYGCQCFYNEYQTRKQLNIIQKTIREARLGRKNTEDLPGMKSI